MMTLSSASSIFKKAAWLIPFVVLIFIFLAVIIFRSIQPKPNLTKIDKPNIKPVAQLSSTFITKNLDINIKTPKSLQLYSPKLSEGLIARAGEIAAKLNFNVSSQKTNDVDLGEGLMYSQNGSALIVYKNTVQFAGNAYQKSSTKLSVENLKNKAGYFINNLGFNIDMENPTVKFYKITEHDQILTNNQNEATYVEFSFNPSINTYPIISSGYSNNISLDFYGNILKFNLRPLEIGSTGQTYPIINFNEALSLLEQNRGIIIKIFGPDTVFQKSLTVDLKKALLAYYIPDNSAENIQPVWLFEGETSNLPVNISISYVTPAISGQYFNFTKP